MKPARKRENRATLPIITHSGHGKRYTAMRGTVHKPFYIIGNFSNPKDITLLDTTLADLLSRYPECGELLSGKGLALFPDSRSLADYGVLLTVKEALGIRGINPDLFLGMLRTYLIHGTH